MKPSPIVFTSVPPWARSASRVMRSCSRSTSRRLRVAQALGEGRGALHVREEDGAEGARCGRLGCRHGLLALAQELVDGRQHCLHVAQVRR